MAFHLPDPSFLILDLGKDRMVQPKSSMDDDSRPDSPIWIKALQKELGRWPNSTGEDVIGQEWRGTSCTATDGSKSVWDGTMP